MFNSFLWSKQRWRCADYCKRYSVFAFHLLWKKKWELFLDPSLGTIKQYQYCSLGCFLCSCELLTSAVLFTPIFRLSQAAREAALRRSINICWVNELTFLKGQSCKRGSSLKVYNLENINYVELLCDHLREPSRKTKQNFQWVPEWLWKTRIWLSLGF